MHLLSLLPLPLAFIPTTLACAPNLSLMARQASGSSNTSGTPTPGFTPGDSSPQPPATLGYTLNHLGLVTTNITASMHFYTTIMGLRHVFTYTLPTSNTSDAGVFKVAYLGYPHGGKNGTGYQTAEELLREQKNIEGLLEIVYLSDPQPGSVGKIARPTKTPTTFSHLGFIVPNVTATEERMKAFDVPILKGVNAPLHVAMPEGEEVATAFGVGKNVVKSPEEAMTLLEGINAFGFGGFLIVADPDGNLLEIQPQA